MGGLESTTRRRGKLSKTLSPSALGDGFKSHPR
ncbi:hypothetical protein FOXYSP1_20558 [Fusarium oxysporum f. sp. phaseoli]